MNQRASNSYKRSSTLRKQKKAPVMRLRLNRETILHLQQVRGGAGGGGLTHNNNGDSGAIFTCGGVGCADTLLDCQTVGYNCQIA
jgi:hypothetical protein